jgi:hypothetical protein
MPTPDASQFIQFKKFSAIGARGAPTPSNKIITHLYQPVPSVTLQTDFLASFTNKVTSSTPNYIRKNIVTGALAKRKVPGGTLSGPCPTG